MSHTTEHLKNPYIAAKYSYPRLPLGAALLYWLYSDRYQFHVVADAIVFTLLALVAIGWAVAVRTRDAARPVFGGSA